MRANSTSTLDLRCTREACRTHTHTCSVRLHHLNTRWRRSVRGGSSNINARGICCDGIFFRVGRQHDDRLLMCRHCETYPTRVVRGRCLSVVAGAAGCSCRTPGRLGRRLAAAIHSCCRAGNSRGHRCHGRSGTKKSLQRACPPPLLCTRVHCGRCCISVGGMCSTAGVTSGHIHCRDRVARCPSGVHVRGHRPFVCCGGCGRGGTAVWSSNPTLAGTRYQSRCHGSVILPFGNCSCAGSSTAKGICYARWSVTSSVGEHDCTAAAPAAARSRSPFRRRLGRLSCLDEGASAGAYVGVVGA